MTNTVAPLPLAWVVILLAAAVAGLCVGLLTYVHSRGRWAVALLAALCAAGATTSTLHGLLSTAS